MSKSTTRSSELIDVDSLLRRILALEAKVAEDAERLDSLEEREWNETYAAAKASTLPV